MKIYVIFLFSQMKDFDTFLKSLKLLWNLDKTRLITQGGYFQIRRSGDLDLTCRFGGKIWGKVRPSSPNERKNLGSSGTTIRKSCIKVPILGSYLKFRGYNLGYLSLIFLEAPWPFLSAKFVNNSHQILPV